jgi:hypothetical protein
VTGATDDIDIAASYSRQDTASVVPLLDALKARGVKVWFDKNIPGGALWEETITRNMRRAKAVLFFVSRASLDSDRCFDEVSAARTLRKSSRASVYRDRVEPLAALLEDYGGAASPEVVSDAVVRALSSAAPRRRYATPLEARAAILLHWLLPDAAWERLTALGLRAAARRTRSAGRDDQN